MEALIFVPSKAEATLLSGHAMLRQRLLPLDLPGAFGGLVGSSAVFKHWRGLGSAI